MSEPLAKLTMINLDSGDPSGLANFYAKALSWEVTYSDENYGMISNDAGSTIGFGRIDSYEPPGWPDESGTKRFHLDLAVTDLEAAKASLLDLGASEAEFQPGNGAPQT